MRKRLFCNLNVLRNEHGCFDVGCVAQYVQNTRERLHKKKVNSREKGVWYDFDETVEADGSNLPTSHRRLEDPNRYLESDRLLLLIER